MNHLMQSVKRWARDYVITDKLHQLITYKRQGNSYAMHDMDNKLIAHFGQKRGGYYVEIGANDGICQSNTAKLERVYGWKGLLIEPSLSNYEKCIKNRGAQNVVTCCACVSFDYEQPFVQLEYLDLMTVPANSSLNKAEHIAMSQSFMPHLRPISFMAEAKTMTKVLDEAQAPEMIDLLSLDVEGAELEVLKGIDFKRYQFSAILIECWQLEPLKEFLTPLGYQFKEMFSKYDALFVYEGRK